MDERYIRQVFNILRESASLLDTDEVTESRRIEQTIHPLLEALGFEFQAQPILSGNPPRRPDFTITNLPVNVIGEVKRPQSYESGKEQIREYLAHEDAEQVGILTDGIVWQVYVVETLGDSFTFSSYHIANLSPVIQEIRERDVSKPTDLNSIDQLEQFISIFSRPEFKRQIEGLDLFDNPADVEDLAEYLDEDSLELLRTEANEKISNLLEQRRFYQSAGFRLGRTTIISLSILVSLAALLMEQQLNSVANLLNIYTIAGTSILVFSAITGIVGPVIVGGLTERIPQKVYREYFRLAIPDEPAESLTSRKDVLITLLKQACKVGNTLRDSVDYLLLIIALSLSTQLLGILLIIYGLMLS